MPDRDDLDILLDSAISTYAEPSSGLAQRVQNALGEQRLVPLSMPKQTAVPIRHWMPMTIALAAAACVLLMFLVHSS